MQYEYIFRHQLAFCTEIRREIFSPSTEIQVLLQFLNLESLILGQIALGRHALHMKAGLQPQLYETAFVSLSFSPLGLQPKSFSCLCLLTFLLSSSLEQDDQNVRQDVKMPEKKVVL